MAVTFLTDTDKTELQNGINNSVKVTEQTLTEEQKAQARENIAALSKEDVDPNVENTLVDFVKTKEHISGYFNDQHNINSNRFYIIIGRDEVPTSYIRIAGVIASGTGITIYEELANGNSRYNAITVNSSYILTNSNGEKVLNLAAFGFCKRIYLNYLVVDESIAEATVMDTPDTTYNGNETPGLIISQYTNRTIDEKCSTRPLVRALIIGDSFSSPGMQQWITPMMREFHKDSSFVTLGVVSATVKDQSNDRSTHPYTSRPTSGTNKNTFACQIEKLKRLMAGIDLDSGETKLYANSNEYPNVIIIAGGQNDGVDTDEKVSNYVGQLEKIVSGVWINNVAGTALASGQSMCIPTPSEELDRTSFAGAYRHLFDELHTLFPDAQIFITTCVSVSYHYGYSNVTPRRNIAQQQKMCAELFAAPVIDWFAESNVNAIFNHATGSGTEADPYIRDNATQDTLDGLHPNAYGGTKLGRLAAKVIANRLLNYK